MDEELEYPNLTESVHELRHKLNVMKRMIDKKEEQEEKMRKRRSGGCKASVIDGNFLSMVFVVVLVLIVTVTFYAFFNLFAAVKKKYTTSHSEL